MSKRVPAMAVAGAVVLVACSSVLAFQPERPANQGQNQAQPGERGARGPGGPGGRGAGMQIPTSQAMNIMNRSLRQLAGQVQDAAKREENLRLINAMQQGCVAAKGQPAPDDALARGADDAERAKIADRYHRSLLSAMELMLEAEESILDGKLDDAAKKLREITALRDKMHVEMGVKDE
ncbi:MAG: hypothetical protein KF838_04135 [Phycisphaeraceae bacterium]|nr:MAG: hypothetical protein KF838_04135 [Phycisphaeraceae bacterium]